MKEVEDAQAHGLHLHMNWPPCRTTERSPFDHLGQQLDGTEPMKIHY
jgi:hypothetical protein